MRNITMIPAPAAGAAGMSGRFFRGALVFLLLLGNAATLFPQTQNVRVYVAPVRGGAAEDKEYFSSNIRLELIGAAYDVVETREESDFYMILAVSRDAEVRDRFLVNLTLFETATDREIITLGKDYRTLEDMNEWNLYLIYQAMANAPISKSVTEAGEDASPDAAAQAGQPSGAPWWDKCFWLGLEADLTYQYPEDGPGVRGRFTAELDFLRFMGLATSFGYSVVFPLIIDNAQRQYYHARADHFLTSAMLKFMFTGANYRVIPSAGAELNLGTLGILQPETPPAGLLSVLGGLDFRLKAGRISALDLGARFIYTLETEGMGFGLSVSYRFGLFPRRAKSPAAPPAAPSGDAPPEEPAAPEAP